MLLIRPNLILDNITKDVWKITRILKLNYLVVTRSFILKSQRFYQNTLLLKPLDISMYNKPSYISYNEVRSMNESEETNVP